MKRSILTCAIIALITSCKTQQFTMPLVIRDSVSVTYRQGKEQPFSLSQIEEQPASPDAIGAQTDFRKNSGFPALGKVGLGATREAAVFEEVQSARTKKQAVPTIRVDTVVIEKWHTLTGGEAEGRKGREAEGLKGREAERIPRFYKDCTIGFWLLLFLLLGRIAFKLIKLIYLRR